MIDLNMNHKSEYPITFRLIGEVIMGNTDKFEMIANIYDTPERIHIAKVSADAIREFLVDASSKNAIDFGCGTGLVGMN